MQKYIKFVLLLGVLLASSLTAGLAPFTSTAFAAMNRHTTPNLAVTKPLSSIKVGHFSVTSTSVTSSQNSAGNPCKTFTSYLNYGYLGVPNEMWLRVVTYFCWNNIIVTYHKTTLYWGVTQAGAASGWGSEYNYYSFNCYNAFGFRACSGNHENDTERFINPFLKDEADLTIDQYEDYLGRTTNWFNAHICPGGC